MQSAKLRPWEEHDGLSSENKELVAGTQEAWQSAGREYRNGCSNSRKSVSLKFLKAVQGHSPTTFNNSTNLVFKSYNMTQDTKFVARTPV
ncbi:uncharacterized protein RAG0_05745 [Rhynchosporium agropyri]|uniref:Uncharacterized protein n=3 Tax=Rhynchosporium TaxID=38037 RepID=A0A1E1MC49_RHYSE|nr:uncharacterized protein RAG0_05745 [Rhynchosporium agropyri]CZT11151.1 uncharacterized protein RCO7_05577 [Rhynchosporium commune]CZT46681.1 uncharacterized protein RSE6_07146 [Rhynchosporium secalis]